MSQADFPNIPALRRPHPPWKLPPPHFWSLSEQDKIVWWLDFHATQLAAENTPQHLYIAQLLSDIGLTFEDLADFRQLTHVKWNDSTNTYDTFSYHCINIPSLVDKATRPIPPPATRATSTTPETVHINACHTGPQGNITAILQQGRLLPSILHFDANPGFFAQATRMTHQSLHDNYEQARILHNTWKLAKNVHSIMVHLLAWGRGTKFTSGGEAHAMQLLQQGHGAVFHSNARCWVIHPHNAIVKGLAWSINATPPDL